MAPLLPPAPGRPDTTTYATGAAVGADRLAVVRREWRGSSIRQREDGYFDLTAMAQANGKRVNNYLRQLRTRRFLAALVAPNSATAIPPGHAPYEVIQGGTPEDQGTWGHPSVAMHMAQWCSPGFEVQVAQWVDDIRTKGAAIHPAVAASPLALARALLAAAEDHEARLSALEADRQARLDAKADAEQAALALPEPAVVAPDKPLRSSLNEVVRIEAQRRGDEYQSTWRDLYRELRYRCHFDAVVRAKLNDSSALDEVEGAGLLPQLYAIACDIFRPRAA